MLLQEQQLGAVNAAMARKRHQQEPPVPSVSVSLPACRLSQHPNTEIPPNPLHLRPSDPPIPDKKGRRSGRRFASLQRFCDCCVSPKRRRAPRRPRHNLRFTTLATGAGSADAANDEGGRIPHFNPKCNSNSNARTRRLKCPGAPEKGPQSSEAESSAIETAENRQTTSIYCSSGCETETLLSTSASGRDEPAGGCIPPCLPKARSKQGPAATALVADSVQLDTNSASAAVGNGLVHFPASGAEELSALESHLLHRQSQQRQNQQLAGNLGMICNPVAGQNTQGILYKATEGISTVAAGAAAVACPSVRHKAAQTAAVLHPSYRRTLLAEQISAASGTAAATATATCPAAAACEDRLFPACSGDETTEAAAAAAEASRAAFLREELLNLAESRYTAVFVPVDKQLLEQMNDEFIRSDISRYPVKNTPSGAFLTEGQFIYQLGIHLSPGWEHFMVFKGEMRELILRRPQQQQDSPNSQNQAYSDEISEESDDSEPEEPTMVASATESPLPPPRHQDLVRLLQQAAETATIHQAKQQKDLLQQQMAIARAVEKANRLLLLIVQLQRPPQHVPPKMFDRMKCLLTNYFFSSVPHYSSEEGQHQLSTARKYLLQNGNFGKQGQLLLLLLQCVAASRQHQQASEAMELPLLQHKMLRQQRGLMQHNAPRISVRGVEKHQQILTPSCAIEAPQDLHERQWEQQEDQREDQQQQKQSTNRQNATRESCRDDGSRRNSSCCGASALRLRKRRGPSLTSPLPVATPHTDSLPRQQQGKRQSGCCNTDAAPDDNAIGSDAASGLANVALPRGFAAKGKAANLPAAATGAISSPTSQRKKKRRRYPLRH